MPSLRSSALTLLLLAGATVAATPVHSQELLTPKVIKRPFPQGLFCPLPIDLPFIANGSTAILRFSTTTVNYHDDNQNADTWSEQSIDNIAVSTDATYQAHLVPLGPNTDQCYIPPGPLLTSVFAFQSAGPLPWLDTFTTDPALGGWDVTHGAYWNPVITAPNDPGTDLSFTPKGALGLGVLDPTFNLADSAFTTRTVTGLSAGVTYHLTGWWNVNQMQLDKITLTVSVSGTGSTPVARRTWGAVKRRYHD